MSRPVSPPIPGADQTLFRGYGPFVALVALILAMALLAPTIAPERDVTTRGDAPSGANLRSSGTTGVRQERRVGVSSTAAANLRSSGTTGVRQERR